MSVTDPWARRGLQARFVPAASAVVFHAGDSFDTAKGLAAALYADVELVDVATKQVNTLAALNGFDQQGQLYLPGGTKQDAHLDYEPSVLPVPVGGYYWVVWLVTGCARPPASSRRVVAWRAATTFGAFQCRPTPRLEPAQKDLVARARHRWLRHRRPQPPGLLPQWPGARVRQHARVRRARALQKER